jgi:molybdopterin-containing oxidoreductase family membrane subunit
MPIMFILSAVAVGPALTMAVAIVIEWITGKRYIEQDILRTIAIFSGFALLVYGYLRFWDAMATSYYGRTPSVMEALSLLRQTTPYNFSLWVFEILLGVVVPAIFFLMPRFNRRPQFLVLGALLAMIGVIVNRWNVTVSGLTVPLSYSPGVLYTGPVGSYFPNLPESGVAVGIVGYAMLMLTLGVLLLPLFSEKDGHA